MKTYCVIVTNKNVYINLKFYRLPRTSFASFTWQRQYFGTITEEKKPDATPVSKDIIEDEKKLKTELELINKELAELKESKDTLEDKYKRALAEGENIRVRLTKQINDAKLFGIQSFCKDLLDVADVLGKATESVPKDEITDHNPHLKSLFEGLVMTEAQLHKVKYIFTFAFYTRYMHINNVITNILFLFNIGFQEAWPNFIKPSK